MRIICDVYDASGNRLGDGPISTLTDVSVSRVLDGAGTIKFSTPATDDRVISLLTVRRRVRLYTDFQNTTREIARGIIIERKFTESASGASFAFTAIDNLEELKYINTLIGRAYKQVALSTVINDLLTLTTGWTATVEAGIASTLIEARFDGASILAAFQQIAKTNGIHFRIGTGNLVEFGAFGTLSTVSAMNTDSASRELADNPNVALIESISADDTAENIVNWVIPLGAGEDAAALKLKRSTRTSPYTIQDAIGPNGKRYWYLSDSASITAYGQVQAIVKFSEIAPITNTSADRINAANALYDAASAYLQRMSQFQQAYSVVLKNVKSQLKPGDKINVRFKGIVARANGNLDYVNINTDFWMIKVRETFNLSGQSVSLDINNIDITPETVEQTIVRNIEEMTLRGLKPAQTTNTRSFVYQREIAPGFPATVPIEITNATLELIRLRVRIKTTPFRATSRTGQHRHQMYQLGGVIGSGFPDLNRTAFTWVDDAGTIGNASAINHDTAADVGSFIYTYGAGGTTEYVIQDDTQYPVNIRIFVNGTQRTAALGGPFAPSGGAINVLLDEALMTNYIDTDAGGFQQSHTLEIRCESGQGRVEVTVEIYEVCQSIDISS